MLHKLLFSSLIFFLFFISSCKDDDQKRADSFNELCCKVPPLEECLEGAKIFVPNVFTPNGDGFNDLFRVYVGLGIEQVNLFTITNQDGDVQFQISNFFPSSSADGWDGLNNNQIQEQGLYNYELTVTNIAAQTRTYTGQVCLRGTFPIVCLEENRDEFCFYGNLHDGNGGIDFSIDPEEICQ